ncbi:MAG: hypothetical protein ABIP81_02130 [Terriglobales bacterium]
MPLAADTPEKAILETIFATDPHTVLKHLPPGIAEAVKSIPDKDRKAAYARFLPERWMSGKPIRSDNGIDLWRYEFHPPHHHGSGEKQIVAVRIQRQLSNGVEAILQLASCQEECYGGVQIWMRHEEGEWRFVEVRDHGRQVIGFDDPAFLANLRSSIEYDGNEPQAVANLRTINTALVTYLSTYESFPQALQPLSGVYSDEVEPTAEHAFLLGEEFMADPCIVGGYRFEYRWMAMDDGEGYTLIARPVDYGRSGRRSFYSDQSGVIRSTTADRTPSENDNPI